MPGDIQEEYGIDLSDPRRGFTILAVRVSILAYLREYWSSSTAHQFLNNFVHATTHKIYCTEKPLIDSPIFAFTSSSLSLSCATSWLEIWRSVFVSIFAESQSYDEWGLLEWRVTDLARILRGTLWHHRCRHHFLHLQDECRDKVRQMLGGICCI